MAVITTVLVLQSTVPLAGIPWAFKMQSTLVRIDTELKTALNVRDKVSEMEARVLKLELIVEQMP